MTPFHPCPFKGLILGWSEPPPSPDHRFLFSTQSRASEPAIEFPILLKSQAFPVCPSVSTVRLGSPPSSESGPELSFRYFLLSLDLTLPRARRWASPISLPDRPPSWTSPGAALAPVSAAAPSIGRFDATASAPLARFVCPAEAPSPWPISGGVASLALPYQTACFCLWKDAECAREGP